jgi:hypothetical protein
LSGVYQGSDASGVEDVGCACAAHDYGYDVHLCAVLDGRVDMIGENMSVWGCCLNGVGAADVFMDGLKGASIVKHEGRVA